MDVLKNVSIHVEKGDTYSIIGFPNLLTADVALNDGDMDVNVEQYSAYAENFNANNDGGLVPISPIPIVPAAIQDHLVLQGVVKEKNKDSDWAKAIVEAYHSNAFKAYLEENNDRLWRGPEELQ